MATAFNRVRLMFQLGAVDTGSIDITVAGDAPGGLITSYADLLAYGTSLRNLITAAPAQPPYVGMWQALAAGDKFTGINAQYVVGSDVVASAYAMLGTPMNGQGAFRHPIQCAVVCSLRTDEAGRSARGRFYFPGTGVEVDSDGTMAPLLVGQLADGFGSLLAAACAQHTDPTAQAQVYSRTLDRMLPVTRVLVDGTVDTQRRRRDKLVTPYQESTTYPV